jgi:enoyl-CoA hydratase/carnithine racemase
MPFARLGLCPEAASSLLLPQAAGFQRAAEALLLGEPFDAAAAVQMGFVCRLLPLSELFTFAAAQTAKLAALPLQSVRMTKALMKRPMAAQVAEQMDKESQEFRKMLVSAEARAVMQAFFNKKKVHD